MCRSPGCTTITTIIPEYFLRPQAYSNPFTPARCFPPPPDPGGHSALCLCGQGRQIASRNVWPFVSFPQPAVFRVRSCGGLNRYFIPFRGWTIVSFVGTHFVCLFIRRWILSRSHFLAVTTNAVVDVHVRVFAGMYSFSGACPWPWSRGLTRQLHVEQFEDLPGCFPQHQGAFLAFS